MQRKLAREIPLLRIATTSKSSKKKGPAADPNQRVISENRKARHNYTVLDSLECGILLVGSEVKSLREGKISLEEAYGRIKDDELWLVGCDIPEYIDANRFNHRPKRLRKLLLHRREIKRFAHRAYEKGLTLVPLKMYFNRGIAKVLMGICRGKQVHDKRQAMKKAEAQRNIQRSMYEGDRDLGIGWGLEKPADCVGRACFGEPTAARLRTNPHARPQRR